MRGVGPSRWGATPGFTQLWAGGGGVEGVQGPPCSPGPPGSHAPWSSRGPRGPSPTGRRRCSDDRDLQVPADTGLLSSCGWAVGAREGPWCPAEGGTCPRMKEPQLGSGWKVLAANQKGRVLGGPCQPPSQSRDGGGGGGNVAPLSTEAAKNVQEENSANASRGAALQSLDLDRPS